MEGKLRETQKNVLKKKGTLGEKGILKDLTQSPAILPFGVGAGRVIGRAEHLGDK